MFTIQDINLDAKDSCGAEIIGVYAKIDKVYAIYRTRERLLVQFSDDPALGADQRKLLAPLGPLRGEINGLIDGWRAADPDVAIGWTARIFPFLSHDMSAKAALFDRRVADALAIALQGGSAEASAILTAAKADIVEERTSVARTEYVLVATMILLLLIGAIAVITWSTGPDTPLRPHSNGSLTPIETIGAQAVGFAAALGSIGALFSIALAIRSREMLTDLQSLDNIIDATMRMLIGAISAVLLYCLIAAGYFTFSFGGVSPLQLEAWQPGLAVIAFVAGFSERLVGNVLGTATLAGAKPANPVAGGAEAPVAGAQPGVATERNPLGRPLGGTVEPAAAAGTHAVMAAVNDDEESLDGGHEHAAPADDDLTPDVELPEAVGGVERVN